VVRRSIDNSLPFGVYKGPVQIGFSRVAPDYATFAWLAEALVLPEFQGQGLAYLDCAVAALDTRHETRARSLRAIRLHAAARARTIYGEVRGVRNLQLVSRFSGSDL